MSNKYGKSYNATDIIHLLETKRLRHGFISKIRVEKGTYVRIGDLDTFPLVELLNADIYLLDENAVLTETEGRY